MLFGRLLSDKADGSNSTRYGKGLKKEKFQSLHKRITWYNILLSGQAYIVPEVRKY